MKGESGSGLKIGAWMKDEFKQYECPGCQHVVWNSSEDIYTLTCATGPFKTKAVVTLQCANCANLTFFDAATVGIVGR